MRCRPCTRAPSWPGRGTSPAGAYELAVDAGDYTLIVDTGGQPFPQCPPIAVQVQVAATATVDIDCVAGAG